MIANPLGISCEESNAQIPVFVAPLVLAAAVVAILLVARVNRGRAKVLALVLGLLILGDALTGVVFHFFPCA